MNVQREKNEPPHPERPDAFHCPPTGLLLSVWCASVESKGIVPIGMPTPSLYGTYPSYGCCHRNAYENSREEETDLGLRVT